MVKGLKMSVADRVLVTGGAGFIGSHLCQRLLEEGHEVLCVDNFSTGTRRNLSAVHDHADFECIRQDVRSPLDIDACQIFHLAGLSGAGYAAAETAGVCVNGALHVLTLARAVKARVLLASTADVYGFSGERPLSEEDCGRLPPSAPCAGVIEGARCAEALFLDAARSGRMPVRVARLFSTYGPRMPSEVGSIVSRFIVQALRGENIMVSGEGNARCSLCYVDDMVDGLIRLMNHPAGTSPVNLGHPAELSELALAELIVALIGSRSKIVHCTPAEGGAQMRCPDISRARGQLGWTPETPLEAGLSMTIAWFELQLTRQALQTTSLRALVA